MNEDQIRTMVDEPATVDAVESPTFEEMRPLLDGLVARYPQRAGAMMPTLWVVQKARGWLSQRSIREVAEYLDVPRAHVEGVISFYTMFKDHPAGREVVMVCKTLSCRLRGAQAVIDRLGEKFAVHVGAHGETTYDGRYHIETAECLGLCDMAPCMLVGEERFGNLTPDEAVRVLEERR